MKLKFVLFCVICLISIQTNYAQQSFDIHIQPSTITSAPKIHSGAFAVHNGKWIFLGGRIDGLHIMQANQAFPTFGRNDSVFVVDPVTDTYQAASVAQLPFITYEALGSSNMQSYQNGNRLYMIGGYGKSDSTNVYTTFPSLISIDLDCLMSNVSSGSSINSCFRQLLDTNLAVCGGEMEKIDSTYYLVFGHYFHGAYAETPQISPFVQRYTHEIRKFNINDDGVNLSISNYVAIQDTNVFHRRDYNLVPQIYPSGEFGMTAFGGVFQKNANQPFLTPIDITSTNVQHQSAFNENLNQYTTATLPVYDSINNFMHTLFFGGMSLYTLDTTTSTLIQDTLVPFIQSISKVTRDNVGGLTEYQMAESMPGYLGTNSFFIPDASVRYLEGGILDLNSVSGNQRVGYIIGGIQSDAPNIAHLDPYGMSRPSATVYEVLVDKTNSDVREIEVNSNINNLIVYPNPVSKILNIDFSVPATTNCDVSLYSIKGKLVRSILKETVQKGTKHISFSVEGLKSGIYLCKISTPIAKKVVKVIVE
jgi:hypothetical protein